jgi:CheY-like chemotaxis protein
MTEPDHNSRRILIVDDNKAIHADFRKILCSNSDKHRQVSEMSTALFGDVAAEDSRAAFLLDFASQGQEALEMVRVAKSEGRPYLAAFIDVRMPPGWDGIETAAKIWEVDPHLEIIVCTAYSDYSWQQIAAKLNRPDKYVVLKKPFDGVEVLQLAHAFTEKARLRHELEQYTQCVEENELRIRTILNAIPQPVFLVDSDVRILEFNLAAGIMLAADRAQVIRQRGGDIMHCINSTKQEQGCGGSEACRTCIIRTSVASVIAGAPVSRRKTQMEFQTPAGIRKIEMLVTAAPIELRGRPLALLILEDITELVELRGLLPICAHCKSVRDDRQYWQSIESYLHTHMNLDFSHGLCPKCAQELYPEAYKKILQNRAAAAESDAAPREAG